MNESIRSGALCAMVAAAALTAGCASPASMQVKDQAYMDAVERAARREGVTVIWVNPPERQVSVADARR